MSGHDVHRSAATTALLLTMLSLIAAVQGFTLHPTKSVPARKCVNNTNNFLPRTIRNHAAPKEQRQWMSLLRQSSDDGGGEKQLAKRRKNVRLQVFQATQLPIVEVVGFAAVLLSSLLVALDTLNDLPPLAYTVIDDTLLAINILFAIDFFVRWYSAGQFKAIYLSKPLVVLDIVVVIVPLLLGSAALPLLTYLGVNNQGEVFTFLYGLQNSAGLQNLLLLRVLRLRRVLTDIGTFGKFAQQLGLKPQDVRPYQLQLARVLLSIFTLLSVASGLVYSAEHQVNPAIPDYFAAL